MAYFRAGTARATHEAQQITVAKTPLASFQSNVSGLYIPEILAYFSATQAGSGDPSPINPRAISGEDSVSVANVSDSTKLQYFQGLLNGTYAFVDMGSLNWSYVNSRFNVSFSQAKMPPNTSTAFNGICDVYTVSSSLGLADNGICITSGGLLRVYDSDYSDATTFQNAMSGHYLIYELATATAPTITTAQFEALCTAFGINGTTATTALGGTYYGGYLNVTTGLLTVTHLGVDMGSLEWTYNATDNYFNVSESRIKSDTIPTVMCEQFTYRGRGSSSTMSTAPTDSIYYFTNALRVKDTRFTDANSFITAVTGQLMMFELKETAYETVQLTPAQIEQLLGQNNVFASTGDVAVKYWRID